MSYFSNTIAGLLFLALGVIGCGPDVVSTDAATAPDTLRIATYNIEDVRTPDLKDSNQPRLQAAAALIQWVRPDILLVNEMTYDQPGDPGYTEGDAPGQNARRFVETFLAVAQADSLAPLRMQPFTAPTNTGLASGFDLDNSGQAVTTIPADLPPSGPEGQPGPQTPAGRAYGNDAWGFGMYPGQYGMALFVREGLEILEDSVRTFRLLRWSAMPEALEPIDPETGDAWYTEEEWASLRLSSKSHWDVPVRLPDGRVLHVLASHPTPPAFDGPERRNQRRNHDEIRFWADYLSGADYIADDSSRAGGLPTGEAFVILGDLNADPDEGSSFNDPIGTWLLDHPRINGTFVPRASEAGVAAYPDLDADDTAAWGLRVDYVLPSESLTIVDGGIVRPDTVLTGTPPSDHFMVWIEVAMP